MAIDKLHLKLVIFGFVATALYDIVLNNIWYSVADYYETTALDIVEVNTIWLEGVANCVVVTLLVYADLVTLL